MPQFQSLGVCASLIAMAPVAHGDELPDAERKKVEHLITFVAQMRDAVFVRNGKEYDAETAAKFIRGKWRSNAKDIATAKDFIKKAASVSSTSGKPYLIRFKDGKETPSAEYLSVELERLEKESP